MLLQKYKARLFEVELLLELIHAAARIDKLLLAGEERMALRADINLDRILRGLGRILRTARTFDYRIFVFRMHTLLHQ